MYTGMAINWTGCYTKVNSLRLPRFSLSVLKSANEKSDCGQTLDPDVKKLVRLRITKILNTQNSFLCSNLCRVSVADNNIRILIL